MQVSEKSRRVEHPGRLDGEVGEVARIQTDAHGLVPLAAKLFEDGDGVGHAAPEAVDSVHEQEAVVRVDLGEGPEGLQFAHVQRQVGLHHAVGVRALGRKTQQVGHANVGREVGAPDERRPRPGVGARVVAPAESELQEKAAAGRFLDSGCLGGDEGLEVEVVQKGRLKDLGHGERPPHHGERHVGVDHPALGDRPHGDAREAAVVSQPGEEILAEDGRPGRAGLGAQVFEVPGRETRLFHPVHEPFKTGVHAVAGLVSAVVGVLPEEVVKLDAFFVEAHAEVKLGHGEFILVDEEDTAGGLPVLIPGHRAPPDPRQVRGGGRPGPAGFPGEVLFHQWYSKTARSLKAAGEGSPPLRACAAEIDRIDRLG